MLSLGACCAALLGPPLPPRHAASRAGPASMRDYYSVSPRGVLLPSMDEPKKPEIDPRRKDPPGTPGPRPGFLPLPMVGSGDDKMDVMSRLLKDRILLLGQGVDDEVANLLVAQLLYLANEAAEKDITLYINSPGGARTAAHPRRPGGWPVHAAELRATLCAGEGCAGHSLACCSVSAGMAIFDTMQYVPCDINTVCFGTAASMGAFLLGAGQKGKRRSLPNSRIMIHQPLGGAQGQAADIEIQAKEILFIRALLCEYIADYTGQPVEDDCDRDFFMTPEEAKDYGIIDEVLVSKVRIPSVARPELMVG
ncbi:putative endopeptidase Clp [Emiliania huxleyi CCMP1516]|uniref:ATP-dependent Clp protease proteolytic subunit n=2 Tax=Emiliania huxleyi TaxID=2903 RepID=A0A0D3IBL1_EMIH1|nr:putative endopeptidase Clp [Emiliania huxleyi CCMP1516]EOD08646.1 putative endopeptidase Clp [Emiliania huxleyi CCMP1516]|eukprot:XP_005761075.1 putative endopeptidase Clp [Emiliania huxleyi CCMP1516]